MPFKWYAVGVVTRETAALVREAVVAAVDPLEIVLFGSVATTATGNDLDMLVVTDRNDGSPATDVGSDLRTVLRPLKRRFDIDDYHLTRTQFAEQLRCGSVFLRKIVSEGICIYMRDGIKAWRRQSEEELDTAEYLLAGGFFRGACYHAQQCVEKSIKTMLLKRGWELEKIHSIHRLTVVAQDHGVPLKLQPADIDFVDAIYRGRYPAESGLLPLGAPTLADAERAVALARQSVQEMSAFLVADKQPSDATSPPAAELTDQDAE